MLFVDESAQQDGWEAFPTQQLTADSYAAELMRGHKKAAAAAKATASGASAGRVPSSSQRSHGAAGTSAGRGASTSGGGAGGSNGGGGGSGGFSLNLGLSGLGLNLSSLGFGGGGGGNPTALEDLHDIMNEDPLAAAEAQRRRRHSDGSSGGFGGGHHDVGEDDWGAPSAPALSGTADPHRQVGGAGGTAGSGGPSWLPFGNASIMSMREGSGGAASNLLSLEPPLWLPDSHASECLSCHLPFRPFTRLRHHCRLCGRIYCSACCHKKALLPPKYGVRTPQRVCELCACALAPHQQLLAGTLAAAAQPPVQDCPDAVSLRAWLNSPWTGSLVDDVFKAANMLNTLVRTVHFQAEAGLPTAALQGAEGLALLTVARVGAGWSFSFGTGLVVARTPDGGWSAPCAVSAAGMGWGLQLGGELADVLLVLRSREALSGLCGGLGAGVVLGGAAGLAMGPVGRHADASLVLGASGGAAAYGYSCSKGAFVGLSLESSLLCVRSQVNLDFYGYPVTPRQLLLEGTVPQPPAAAMLYEGIKALLHRFEARRHLVHSRSTHSASAPHQRPQPRAAQQPRAGSGGTIVRGAALHQRQALFAPSPPQVQLQPISQLAGGQVPEPQSAQSLPAPQAPAQRAAPSAPATMAAPPSDFADAPPFSLFDDGDPFEAGPYSPNKAALLNPENNYYPQCPVD
ncbi:hypothetical protein GPECTOR_4g987 [Gonium pectorale]|uniref:FYVE-type domain-containing protein n=1 Tax=Gonium pectorale TaxID=33097 RepID=A0A150GYM9_GONPE|nr:hypothetical protein GPECTOR_4g987 [Gonium pectorale]|eukprot:KXZ54915.1 hypothetical protein GPECTOR_4g987 [Gonium pectorale]